MTSIRNLFYLVLAATLTAFALPASAAKTISLTVPAGPLAAGVQQIQVSINNTGNSNANSFEIDWIPSANFSVQGGFVTADPSNVGTPKNPGVYGSPFLGLVFNKQAPNKTSVAITLNVTVTPSCTSTPVTWKAAAWTGSPGPLSTSFTLEGGPYQTTIVSLNCVACNTATDPVFPPVPGTGYFATLPAGVTSVTQPGFAAGYRLKDDKHPELCALVDYTFTNNITGTGTTTDPNGNTLPANAAGLVWNQAAGIGQNAVFVYMLTFQPEYVATAAEAAQDPSLTAGLPKKKTKFCILSSSGPTDCSNVANQATLQACIGTAFGSASIPGSDPACIMQETWTTVPGPDCVAAGVPNPNFPNPPPACVRATDLLNDARDPPMIRG